MGSLAEDHVYQFDPEQNSLFIHSLNCGPDAFAVSKGTASPFRESSKLDPFHGLVPLMPNSGNLAKRSSLYLCICVFKASFVRDGSPKSYLLLLYVVSLRPDCRGLWIVRFRRCAII